MKVQIYYRSHIYKSKYFLIYNKKIGKSISNFLIKHISTISVNVF